MANLASNQARPAPISRQSGERDPFERIRDLLALDPFRDFPRRWFGDEAMSFAPRFDTREDKDCFVIQADMPGIKQADVDISITGNRLVISGQREEEKAEEAKSYYTRERSFGAFSRAFMLPDMIDVDHIQASMRDGVLELKIPKSVESQPKKIRLGPSDGGSQQAAAEGPPRQAPKEEGM